MEWSVGKQGDREETQANVTCVQGAETCKLLSHGFQRDAPLSAMIACHFLVAIHGHWLKHWSADEIQELREREYERGIVSNVAINAFMKGSRSHNLLESADEIQELWERERELGIVPDVQYI